MHDSMPSRDTALVSLAVFTVVFAPRADSEGGSASLRLLLAHRIREPLTGKWALPGGPIDPTEGIEHAAGRHLLDTTALSPNAASVRTPPQSQRRLTPAASPNAAYGSADWDVALSGPFSSTTIPVSNPVGSIVV